MKYQEFKPDSALSDYIQLIWILESEAPQEHYARDRIVPDGIVELVCHYRTPFTTYASDGSSFLQPQGFLVSQMRRFIEIESAGDIGFIAVRFYPWGAHHFFGKPISSFLDNTVDAAEIWPEHFDRLQRQLAEAPDKDLRLAIVQSFLGERLTECRRFDAPLERAIKLLRNASGELSLEEVCRQTGHSKKQLERKFVASIGTTPKVFSRISRFLAICNDLQANRGKTLTQLALDCGYFDQAHFIKEFKEFSGFTPKQFFAQDNVSIASIE